MSVKRLAFSIDGASTADLGFTVSSRAVSALVQKTVRKTVPYMSGSYDFTKLYGAAFYEDREVSYTLDAIGAPDEVEEEVSRILDFLMGANESAVADSDSPGYHWRASYGEADVEWDESGEAATVTATLAAYPFRIADAPTERRVGIGDNTVVNLGWPARITVVPDGSLMTIQIGALKQSFSAETEADILLPRGTSTVKVTSGGGTIRWREEVV